MELAHVYDHLVSAAERLGIRVREEVFDPNLSDIRRPRGGLCTVRGERIILVDAKLPLPERIATVAASLSAEDLEPLFLPPVVRATVGAYAHLTPPAAAREPEEVRPALRLIRGERK